MFVTKYVDNTQYGQSSVSSLTAYLEKEQVLQQELDETSSRELSAYLDKQNDVVRFEGREYFFNGSGKTFDSADVTKAIDGNVKGLKKKEARYYTFSISPSAQEIKHLRRTIADTRQNLLDAGESIPVDFEDSVLRSYLKEYAIKCMDAYAQNFGHPEIRNNQDLLWFGMVEKDRYWKSQDSEVRTNSKLDKQIEALRRQANDSNEKEIARKIAVLEKKYVRECQVRPGGSKEILRPMMPKAGDNWHVHVAVSRRDITNSINLSPNANGRGSKKHRLNGKSVRVGFNRETFKINCEHIFDRQFAHTRLQTESYECAKALRKESAFAFEKQRLQDRATRRAEDAEFGRLQALGYNEYFENLIQVEQLDGRHLLQLKGYIARQIQNIDPSLKIDKLMTYDLDELQEKLAQMDDGQEISVPNWAEGAAANIGDKIIHVSGLQGYNPICTTQKIIRKGIALNVAVNRRQEVFNRWYKIYSEKWYRENYQFESISSHRNTECFFAQAEYLEETLGESVISNNAQDYAARTERQLVDEFLKSYCPKWKGDVTNQFAVRTFGRDAADVRSFSSFEKMAHERLLPDDARRCVDELKKHCEQPKNLEALRHVISEFQQPGQAVKLTKNLDDFVSEHGRLLEQLRKILTDTTLSVHAKEEALMKLALDDKSLEKALKDIRGGVLKILERQNPKMKYGELKEMLDKIFKDMQEVVLKRQTEFAEIIDGFLQQELPGYYLIVEKESQFEHLLRDITPEPEKYAELLLEAKSELAHQMAPHVEALFERHGQHLFGAEVHLRNEHDFVAYIEKNVSPARVDAHKNSLRGVYTKIEEKRREVIQEYVNTKIPSKELERVKRQQNYINRYINKKYSAQIAKSKKEQIQQRVAASCKRQIRPVTGYKVFGLEVQKRVTAQAMAKASLVKILPITPQQVILKGAFKLINILTKGY